MSGDVRYIDTGYVLVFAHSNGTVLANPGHLAVVDRWEFRPDYATVAGWLSGYQRTADDPQTTLNR